MQFEWEPPPEGISQQAWDEAHEVAFSIDWHYEGLDYDNIKEAVARAIMAGEQRGERRERDACRNIAAESADAWVGENGAAACAFIAAEIGKRGREVPPPSPTQQQEKE